MEKEAEYQISSSVKDGILEIILACELTAGLVEQLENKIVHIIQAAGENNLLVDARAVKGRTIITKVYIAARRPFPHLRAMDVAVLDLPENAAQQVSLEAIARNAGHSIKFFADMDAAREWLKSKSGEERTVAQKEHRRAERLEEENEFSLKVISGKSNLPREKITSNNSLDLSVTGARIKTNILFPVDTLLMLEFSLDGLNEKISAMGKVKWVKVLVEGESYEEGVEFSGPSKKLAEYIGWKQKSKSLNPA